MMQLSCRPTHRKSGVLHTHSRRAEAHVPHEHVNQHGGIEGGDALYWKMHTVKKKGVRKSINPVD